MKLEFSRQNLEKIIKYLMT